MRRPLGGRGGRTLSLSLALSLSLSLSLSLTLALALTFTLTLTLTLGDGAKLDYLSAWWSVVAPHVGVRGGAARFAAQLNR